MQFDVIVIGAGHAGCEAAHASAKMGRKTALLTMNPDRIGFMSCNPAMGGLAKGQLIREIDALGGIMGINTDKTAIQYRRLNSSKGPAVRSSRAQCDKALYSQEMSLFLRNFENLTVLPVEATGFLIEGGSDPKISGVILSDGGKLFSRAVVVTTGTFLKAIMHTGFEQAEGGRVGDQAANHLSDAIRGAGLRLRRLKTGTPPRLDRDTIDFSKTVPQPGDEVPVPFSFYFRPERFPLLPQVNCYITYTNAQTHEIIEKNFGNSPLFTGVIKGLGPRYCPSIEDKVKRFSDKDRHQIFLEPEGLSTREIYVNGISTSLPREVQEKFVRSINGLEAAQFMKFGYAVEYDAIEAPQLKNTLEYKDLSGLYFAGQVNGTSGYEEAGAQGLIAGINAALTATGSEPFILGRATSYIGVLVDDLVTKALDEPYRMFTSRAEHRLSLREDNADLRLSELGYKLGLLSAEDFGVFEEKRKNIEQGILGLKSAFILPTTESNQWIQAKGMPAIRDRVSCEAFLRRPEVSIDDLPMLSSYQPSPDPLVREQIEIQTKYSGYIERDRVLRAGLEKSESMVLPKDLNYSEISGLSTEVRGILSSLRPETIGQASRIGGVTPSAIASLMIHLKIRKSG